VGDNPNDLELTPDGRLFVSCANENSVYVIDTKTRRVTERIWIALHPRAPVGATPNALLFDAPTKSLFVANADNNSVAVVNVAEAGRSTVEGFIPAGWYPSALAIAGRKLFVGNSKGLGGYANIRGPHSKLPPGEEGAGSVKSLQKGSINIIALAEVKPKLKEWTRQVFENCPYKDEYLAQAKAPKTPSVIPREVGAGSPIQHVIYVIRENRTYDQVLGDLPKGNGDARICLFPREVTPNAHKLAEEFVLLDNLFCDGEVSVDGHSWSNSAYATDFNEKFWPPNYGGHSKADPAMAFLPGGGHLWDAAAKKGLTYRSYGEYVTYSSEEKRMVAIERVAGLYGHVAPHFKKPGMRDTDNVKEFIRELEEFEKNYDSPDPQKRLPNLVVMSLPEDHTVGTTPGRPSPRAMVANNDHAIGMLVERVTNSRYWPETAIFIIEDDAQDGADHVDARRTVGLVVSPYTKRGIVDSTLYSTSSFLRSMELLLGLPPMTQYDAAATPLYASFGTEKNLKPYTALPPRIDVNELNTALAWGAKESLEMDFSEVDRAPMHALNVIIWKSVKGANSEMPAPVHSFSFTQR
jgi:YVTN family beta-propeller protein